MLANIPYRDKPYVVATTVFHGLDLIVANIKHRIFPKDVSLKDLIAVIHENSLS